jgi:2-polyprenyl-3-methyl-5-hydroxy-6-metoxy-1,4-benzoquinol methylase
MGDPMNAAAATQMTRSLSDRLQIFARLLEFVRPHLPPDPKVIDLGCGHCLFLKAAIDAGFDAAGIDARLDRVPAGMPVRRQTVQETDIAPYDLILCLGIFYHLTCEDQVAMVKRFKGKIAVVDTHYGIAAEMTRAVGGETYEGEIYLEGTGLTSSFGNRESFWPVERDLIRLLAMNHSVLKWLPEHHPGRSFYLLMP